MERKLFKHPTTEELLHQEHEQMGLDFNAFVKWLEEPPSYSTFRVNTLQTSPEEAAAVIDDKLQEDAKILQLKSHPPVRLCSQAPDVVIVGSWNSVPGYTEKWAPGRDRNIEDTVVIVDAICGAAILRGAHLFAPGVLALPKGSAKGETVSIFADLDGRCLKGSVVYNGATRLVGRGVLLLDRQTLFGGEPPPRGVAVQVNWTPNGVLSVSLPPELGQLQNLPSAVAAHELAPEPGQLVLDLCAAPGNKTSHLAAISNNQATIIAIDRNEKKCEIARATCASFGAKSNFFAFDSTKACDDAMMADKSPLDGPPFRPNTFDKVLLDAPCSALGQRPQLSSQLAAGQLKSCAVLQKRLFRAAVRLLKPGGVLVYCTCSISLAENEALVQWALSEFIEGLQLIPPTNRIASIVPLLNIPEEITSKVQRFGPPVSGQQTCDSIGFFISKFVKIK